MARVYVGNLDERVTEGDLKQDFGKYGRVHFIWVAKKPPGFAFIDFEDGRDAEDAVRKMNGAHGWRVEISRKSYGARGGGGRDGGGREGGGRGYGGGGGGGGREMACFNCGEVGHLARDCRARGVPPMRRDRSPPRRDYRRSPSPRGRSRSRSRSPVRRHSPPPRRRDSPPLRRDSPPPRRDSPPPRRDSPPLRRGSTPPRRDGSSPRKGSSPLPRDDDRPVRRDSRSPSPPPRRDDSHSRSP